MKKLLIVINTDYALMSHRIDLAINAKKDGFEVHIACGVTELKEKIQGLGFVLHDIKISRSGINIFKELMVFLRILSLLRKLTPSAIHFITIKPIVYGGIASRILRLDGVIFAVSGLGYVFSSEQLKAKIIQRIIKPIYKYVFNGKNSKVILQNHHDINFMMNSALVHEESIVHIPGAGVSLEEYPVTLEPKNLNILMASRLLSDKGVFEFIEASNKVMKVFPKAQFTLAGGLDYGNPECISENDLMIILANSNVSYIGYCNNIYNEICNCNIAVLPSYREGLPKFLIEAAASGRASITTFAPGCSDVVDNYITGLLVPIKNSDALSDAIIFLLKNETLRNEMGKKAREKAEKIYSINDVINTHLDLYNK
jgi:glycosyltransferase involved in cell wall biosynthesis